MTFLRDAGERLVYAIHFPNPLACRWEEKRAVNQMAGSVTIIRGTDCIIEPFNKEVADGIVGYYSRRNGVVKKKKKKRNNGSWRGRARCTIRCTIRGSRVNEPGGVA